MRLLNWGVENDLLKSNPVQGLKKPKKKSRDTVYTADQWKEIRGHVTDSFGDLLDFLYYTGCRPQEARTLEDRHVHDDMIVFPAEESKGGSARVLYLVEQAKELVASKKGVIFRNSNGEPWTANAVRCRMRRIAQKVGYRVIAYGARHSFATNALMNDVDPISVAHLMGHKNTRMISEVYSHLATNPKYLKEQAKKAMKE